MLDYFYAFCERDGVAEQMEQDTKRKVCKTCKHDCHCDTVVCTECHCSVCDCEKQMKFPDWG